ncbi:MAG TPA: lipocalin-like domain-containing protein [Candidatus Methylacidiphilales bacterium]|nr:lipocalin-like domain-containing protein [Candidatus Methylacidiphilales bacterium]
MVFLVAPPLQADPPLPDEPWQRVIGAWSWMFPRDHGAHPNFKTEWWYFTGNLQDAQQGRRFGYQLTLFRQGIQFTPAQRESKWAVRDIYFGHFTISDLARGEFHVAERVSRGALGEAKAATDRMDVALGPWTIRQEGAKERIHLVAREPEMAIDFEEDPLKPLVLEGVGGLSRKADGAGEASYYYSYPRLATQGQLRIGSKTYGVSGLSWFDHEFSTSSLGRDQIGWDWFCIQLDDGEEIMLYAMRDKSGAIDPVSEGTWVKADGTSERILPGSFSIGKKGDWRSPGSGAVYPAGWHIVVPGHRADLTVIPAMADQELRLTKMGALDYWEGACSIEGSIANAPVRGAGYTELTGYAGALQAGMKE